MPFGGERRKFSVSRDPRSVTAKTKPQNASLGMPASSLARHSPLLIRHCFRKSNDSHTYRPLSRNSSISHTYANTPGVGGIFDPLHTMRFQLTSAHAGAPGSFLEPGSSRLLITDNE